jgi:hypothetical protein
MNLPRSLSSGIGREYICLFVSIGVIAAFFLSCSKNAPQEPVTSSPVFAIHDGNPRPACACQLTRIDLVSPETIDTASWDIPQKVAAPLNTDCPEDDCEISDDGQTLYYYGSPTQGPDYTEILTGTTGIYYAQRTGGPGEFGTSRFIDLRKKTKAGAGDGHPRLNHTSTTIFFHSIRAENTGFLQPTPVNDLLDIYTAELHDTVASPAVNLGPIINSIYTDGEPEISPDGTTLYFASDRPGGQGGSDIYFSVSSAGTWSAPENIGLPINTSGYEAQCAFAYDDPNTMYFTSDRAGLGMAIYRSHFDGTSWDKPELVVQGQVGSPSLTADGTIMYFVHVQTDNTPGDPVFGADIYYIQHR